MLWAAGGDPAPLDRTQYTQPVLFALQAALAAQWRAWGIEPAAVLGHSVGELAAAHVAGILSLADGLMLAAARGRLMQSLAADGAMAVVFAGADRVASSIAPQAGAVAIAAVNGPDNTVIAGRADAVADIVAQFRATGIKARPINVALPAHSPRVDPILDAFTAIAAGATFRAPEITFVSGVTGAVAGPAEVANAAYWRRNLREPVQFAAGVATLAAEGCRAFVEIGPGATLVGMARRAWPAEGGAGVWAPSLRPDRQDGEQMLDSLARLYVAGAAVNWSAVEHGPGRRRLALPTYPWQREAYWLPEVRAAQQSTQPGPSSVWQAAVSAGDRQSGQAPLGFDLAGHPGRWAALDALAFAYIAAAVRRSGGLEPAGAAVTVDGLLTRLGGHPGYRGLMTRWLRLLSAAGMCEVASPGEYRATPPEVWPDVAGRLAAARERFIDGPTLPDYVQRCGEALSDVVAGRRSPLDLLFPGGRLETADYLYRTCDVPRYCNAVARAIVEAAAGAWPPGRPLRVIDIGAGTGGLAADVLPVLPPDRADYTFTDVSDFFFARASERFGAYPFMHCARLDIEQSPADQGFGRHGFDIALAANVLHATRDVDAALAHVRSLLAPGGLLVVFETTEHPTWFDATIALIDGWSRHQDDGRRREHPLLSADAWLAALDRAGFAAAAAWPGADSPAAVLGGHVLAARAPEETGAGARPASGLATTATAARSSAATTATTATVAGVAPVPPSPGRSRATGSTAPAPRSRADGNGAPADSSMPAGRDLPGDDGGRRTAARRRTRGRRAGRTHRRVSGTPGWWASFATRWSAWHAAIPRGRPIAGSGCPISGWTR